MSDTPHQDATLRVVTGKGGVGRSTVAAALALQAAEAGRRVLAIDAVGSGGLDRVVDEAGIGDRFPTLRLTTAASLDEYLRIYLKVPIGPSRLGPLARIFEYVSAAAPGVRELLVIGKIGWEVRNGPWDEVIVDGPASGHIVELLTAPRSMAELIPTGPLAEQTGWLREVLAAPTTGVQLVTLPEELPTSEAVELVARLERETDTVVDRVIVNRVPPAVGPAGRDEAALLAATDPALAPVLDLVVARDRAATAQLSRIEALNRPMLSVAEDADPVAAVLEALTAPQATGAGPDAAAGPARDLP